MTGDAIKDTETVGRAGITKNVKRRIEQPLKEATATKDLWIPVQQLRGETAQPTNATIALS